MPITNLPPLTRYLDDTQWSAVGKAIRAAGGQINDGNRLHVDAILDLMKTRMPWRDLDQRYGPWPSVHSKYVRWYEAGVLHGVVQALFDVGLTEEWRPTFTEITKGLSARCGPPIRPLMTQIVVELRRNRELKGRKGGPKLAKPEGTIYSDKKKQYAQKVKEAVASRKGTTKCLLTNADWELITSRIPDITSGPQNNARRQIDELLDVMRTNKGWNYIDVKAGKSSMVYAKFAKWVVDGTMDRLVRCLAELGLTEDWNKFLVAPLAKGETALKLIIGSEAHRYVMQPKKKGAGAKRRKAKLKVKAAVATKVKAAAKKAESKPSKKAGVKHTKAAPVRVSKSKATDTAVVGKTVPEVTLKAKVSKEKEKVAKLKAAKLKAAKLKAAKEQTKQTAAKKVSPGAKSKKGVPVIDKVGKPVRESKNMKPGRTVVVATVSKPGSKRVRTTSRPSALRAASLAATAMSTAKAAADKRAR